MDDYYHLAFEHSFRDPQIGYSQKTLRVSERTFNEMIEGLEGIASQPDFGVIDIKKTHEEDIYTYLSELSLGHLVYVYKHQDEFVFMNKRSREKYGGGIKELGVFWKEQKEEADNLAFRNALTSYFGDKLSSVSEIMFGKGLPDLVKKSPDYSTPDRAQSYNFCSAHENVLPEDIEEVNISRLELLERNAAFAAETFKRTAEQLKSLRESILESGGDEKFRELFLSKMIPYFMNSLPLFINVEDKELKDMAQRAMKKKYY
jgi:hypothetical protein